MRIHYLKHVPFEGPVKIATWAEAKGHRVTGTEFFKGQPVPSTAEFDWLVIMGGPMSVHDEDEYPWLTAEKRLIERSLHEGKRVLGVCLGAQLLADVLGAKVHKNKYKEIGWFPVRRTREATLSSLFHGLTETFTPFHWHGETFDLPAGAIHLAESDGCRNQAFQLGDRALGLQFHLEVTRESVAELARNCASDIGKGPYEQAVEQMVAAGDAFASIEPLLYHTLDRMAAS